MANPADDTTLEGMMGGTPGVRKFGLNTNQPVNFSGFLVDTSGNVTFPNGNSAGLPVFNVSTYGAKGDNTTDDTISIQNAINAAQTAGGGIVFFPIATYKITSALTAYANIWYMGAGASYQNNTGACINQTGSNVDAFRFTNTTNKTDNVIMSGLRIQGPGTTTGSGIYLKNTGHSGTFPPFIYFSIRDTYIANFNGTGACGINAEGSIVSVFERVVCETCTTSFFLNGAAGGVNWDTTVTSCTLNACYANGATGTGFKLKNVVYTTLNNCASDSPGTAYLIDTCNAIVLNACGCEWNNPDSASPGDGFKITGSNQVTLNSPYTFQNFHLSFWITGNSDGITLIGPAENTPITATNSIKIDSGSHVTSINMGFTTARSEAAGSHNILDDATGSAVIPGPVYTTLQAPVIRAWDGWEDANESWAFATSTTITVPTGAASKYRVGDKIKLTQTTVKYFYITAVADTVLTVTGGTDYTVANAAISANYYSHFATPIGFPNYFNYTPTITSGTGTFTTTAAQGRFSINGRTCHVGVEITVTTHGTAAQETRYTLPVNAASSFSGDFEHYVGSGLERFNTGDALVTRPISATVAGIRNYVNGFDGGDGSIQEVSLTYEI